MTDGVDMSTGAPRASLGAYVNAFRAGRAAAARAPEGANALSAEQGAAPDLGQRIASLTPDQRNLAARQAEVLGAVGQGLARRPYDERRALLSHLAPALAAHGVAPAAVAAFDPTDANLATAVNQAAAIRAMLGGAN